MKFAAAFAFVMCLSGALGAILSTTGVILPTGAVVPTTVVRASFGGHTVIQGDKLVKSALPLPAYDALGYPIIPAREIDSRYNYAAIPAAYHPYSYLHPYHGYYDARFYNPLAYAPYYHGTREIIEEKREEKTEEKKTE